MSFTRVPKASSATFRAVSFPDELPGIEKSSAHNRKTTMEKKKRIVQLVDTFRKAVSYDVTRNTIRCCGELDFASHNIISTCDRLRIVLHSAEGTAEEWSTIRNVSMEQAKLEVAAHSNRLLKVHVESVRKLGNEIRERIILGFSSAFESAMNGNPSGALDLVEAAEMYERAVETFEKKWNAHGNIGGFIDWLGFKNMRATELYHDFELRGVEKFRGLANLDDVLQTATELVSEIDIVKHRIIPCFASHWHIEALWSSAVAQVCTSHIVHHTGGHCENLPDLTVTQLLELVAWIEYFHESISETFPGVASMHNTRKTHFEECPALFAGEKRLVNMQNARERLAWDNLREVHKLSLEEFLVRTRNQTDEWLDKVYGSESAKNQSVHGKLTTTLCEDVFSFCIVQVRTIRERLSKNSGALVLAVCIILSHMRSKQVHARNNFLRDLESCCAASNDFTRMSEKCEDMVSEVVSQCEFSEDLIAKLETSSGDLMGVYSSDAVYSARSVHIYVFDPIEDQIGVKLFEEDWEGAMVNNDLATSLVRTLADFHEDLEHFMDNFMVGKSMMSLTSATVIFYAKCLLQRAKKHSSSTRPYFGDVKKALDRMAVDIIVLIDYFVELVPEMPSLRKNINKDFEILTTIHELLSIAAGFSVSDAEDFILILHKHVRVVGITKHIVGDLWRLVAPMEEQNILRLVESMKKNLLVIAPDDDALGLEVNDRAYIKGLLFAEMTFELYGTADEM